MKGNYGCPCSGCRGAGTIHQELKAKLCGIETLFGVEVVVTKGFHCAALGDEVSHAWDKDGQIAHAVDFYPRQCDRSPVNGRKWGIRRFDFCEAVRPYFAAARVVVNSSEPNKWSIHAELGGME